MRHDRGHLPSPPSGIHDGERAPLTPTLCRAARAILDWTQGELAQYAHIARSTLADFERGTRVPFRNNIIAIITAFEAAGVTFHVQQLKQGKTK